MRTRLLEQDLTGSIGTAKYLCTLQWRNGQIIMDEPKKLEGQDLGPDPYTMLLASLAGCTLSTLRMYIDRKGWDIPDIHIATNLYQDEESGPATTITRSITFSQEIDEATRHRLLVIAEKCPISKILKNDINIQTTL